nr:hypothetical protein [Tanacetum cinerariifolium]
MDNKNHIVNLESFREMLHIYPRLPHQTFVEPLFKEEILAFLCFLGHSEVIRKLTDVNINKLHQPWRSFAAIINKTMDTTIDQQVAMVEALVPHAKRLRIGRSIFRLLSDINSKESTFQLVEMLHICPRLPHQPFVEPPFEEEIIAFLCFLGHSAVIRKLTDVNINKLHQPWRAFKRNVDFAYLMWEDFVYQVEHKDTKKSNEMYYPRFMKVIIHHFMSNDPSISRRNKPKASVWKTRSSFDTTITPPTATAGPRLTTSNKGKQAAKASKAKSLSSLSEVAMTEAQQLKLVTKRSLQQTHISQASGSGADKQTGSIPGVPDVPTDECEEEISWNSTDEEGDDDEGKDGNGDDGDDGEEGDGNDDDDEDDDGKEGNGEENLGLNVGREEGYNEEEEEDELYKEVNINQGRGIQMTQEVKDSHVTLTLVNPDGQQQSSLSSKFVTSMLNPTPDAGMESIFETTSQMDAQTLTSRMNEAVKVAVQLQSDQVHDEAQSDNDEFLKTIDENMQKIIKEQVKEQVKRRHNNDADKDEQPFAGPDRGSKRCREGKEPESASTPKETATRSAGRSTQRSKSQQISASESATAEEPMQTTFEMEEPSHPVFETCANDQPIVQSS